MESRKNNLKLDLQLPPYNILPDPADFLCSSNYKQLSINHQFQRVINKEFSSASNNFKSTAWQKLKILESFTENETVSLFCGSQVTSIDWAPSSSKNCDSYLAVSCNVAENVSVIQVWCLKNKSEDR